MKVFHCGHCDQLVFFENTTCVNCDHILAFLPDVAEMGALEPEDASKGLWRLISSDSKPRSYRLCQNYSQENVCNWAVPADDPNAFCRSCRLTRTIPIIQGPSDRENWARVETAKRRMIYSLLRLNLPVLTKAEDPEHGLAFDLLSEVPGGPPVMTGHDNGVITLNMAEGNDAERERRRLQMNEPYRTLLGHFRHEIGHYYWNVLIDGTDWIDQYRSLFGDEREDYGEALKRHHANGAPADWVNSYVSAYASAHSWEDWAETWAHYMHISDTLETAVASGLSLRPRRSDEPALKPNIKVVGKWSASFDELIERWFPLTYALNNLSRGMGLQDIYPFVLSPPAIDKLRFVHEVITETASTARPAALATAAS
ncbi:zinc-binding metallopeptidase family protein [Singulisphaera sp. PoT]|uniref:zinc-binding metallopeptidase family protein n=1 Tax=Singulisphaera sp. PoT TaxID=3411797 RepID=UPI003BF60B43